jgi:hypothetical protein
MRDTLGTARAAHCLVFSVATRCFDGVLPNDPHAVTINILVNCFPDISDEEQLQEIAAHLYIAANKHLEMQYCQFPL